MAFYDKSARVVTSVAISLVIHVVLIGLLVSTQFVSDESEKESPQPETAESPKESPQEVKKDEPPESKPIEPKAPVETHRSDKPSLLQTEPRDPFLVDSPKPQPKQDRKSVSSAAKTVREKTPSVKDESEPVATKETSEATEIYVVKKGESLTSIARAHGCTLAELTRLNRNTLKKNKSLYVGAKLRVPKK